MSVLRRKSTSKAKARRSLSGAPAGPELTDVQSAALIRRFTTHKAVIKTLIAFLDGLIDLQRSEAKRLGGLSSDFSKIVPFEDSTQFLPPNDEQGLTNLLEHIKITARRVADHSGQQAQAAHAATVEPLVRLKADVKTFIKSLETELARRETSVQACRDTSAVALADLATSLSTAKARPLDVDAQTDPFIVDRAVRRALEQQTGEENALQEATATWQARAGEFEKHIITELKTAWQQLTAWQGRTAPLVGKEWSELATHVKNAPTGAEWARYLSLHPQPTAKTPQRSLDQIKYPGQRDELSIPIKQGLLERKRRYTKMRSTVYVVLTKTGHIHCLQSIDAPEPELSLFLPNCMLGPAPDMGAKTQGFWVGGNRSVTSKLEARVKGTLHLGSKELEYVFIAKTHDEALAWWNEFAQHAKASYTTLKRSAGPAAEAIEHAGLIPAAATAGIDSDDEEPLKGDAKTSEPAFEEGKPKEAGKANPAPSADSPAAPAPDAVTANSPTAPAYVAAEPTPTAKATHQRTPSGTPIADQHVKKLDAPFAPVADGVSSAAAVPGVAVADEKGKTKEDKAQTTPPPAVGGKSGKPGLRWLRRLSSHDTKGKGKTA